MQELASLRLAPLDTGRPMEEAGDHWVGQHVEELRTVQFSSAHIPLTNQTSFLLLILFAFFILPILLSSNHFYVHFDESQLRPLLRNPFVDFDSFLERLLSCFFRGSFSHDLLTFRFDLDQISLSIDARSSRPAAIISSSLWNCLNLASLCQFQLHFSSFAWRGEKWW